MFEGRDLLVPKGIGYEERLRWLGLAGQDFQSEQGQSVFVMKRLSIVCSAPQHGPVGCLCMVVVVSELLFRCSVSHVCQRKV